MLGKEMPMTFAIKTDALIKEYPGFVLGPLSLEVPTGTVLGIVGANGAGKTTFIKCLLGLVEPNRGSVELLGTPIARPEDMSATLKERIGVVLDACAFSQESSVADVAQLGRVAYRTWNQARFDALSRTFALDGRKRVRELSRGMGMKLSLAFALAHEPDLLILDEATAGLDPLARDEMLDMLRTFLEDEGHTIMMASHITSDLEKLADTILCLDEGQVRFDVSKDVIIDEAGVAHLREADLEALRESPFADGTLRILRQPYSIDALVPDRFAFAKAFPSIPLDRASLDDYLAFTLKGESL